MKIHLFQTNDLHSQLENYMRLAARLRQDRDACLQQGEPALTFDIGDVLDRVRPETEATYGDINAAMMAALGYDGWIFGNNEGLTIPVEHWGDMVRLSQTPVLGSNVRSINGECMQGFADHRIFDFSGVRVGVFGLTVAYPEPYELLAVDVSNPILVAQNQVKELQEQGCQLIVVLSHLGLWSDRELAAQVPGIHMVLGGHSHNLMTEAEWVEGTAIFQPGPHGLRYGHSVVEFDESCQKITSITCEALPVDVHDPLDPRMFGVYQAYEPAFNQILNEPVAYIERPLPVQMDRESPLANILVEGLLDSYPADLGLMMAGALNASLRPGNIRRRDVLAACSTPTRPVRMTLSGCAIRGILEKSIQPEYYGRKGWGYGFRGGVIGFMAVSNARIEYQMTPEGARLLNVTVGGSPLDLDRDYRVVTCEYLWLSPVYEEFRKGRQIQVEVPLVRETLAKALSNQEVLRRASRPHYYQAK